MLAIPLAWNADRAIIWPEQAKKQTDYWCPECLDIVHLRGGSKVRLHFYHVKPGLCTGEGARHAAAKHWLVDTINRGEFPLLHYWCPRCFHDATYSLPPKVATAEAEVSLGDFRVDVGLFDAHDTLVAALEVWDRHRVNDGKAAALSIPWAELTAERVLHNVDNLRVHRTGGGWREPQACKTCRKSWVPMEIHGQSAHLGYNSPDERWYRQRFFIPWAYAMLEVGNFIGANMDCPRLGKTVTARYCQQCSFHDSFHVTDYPDEEAELLADPDVDEPAEHSHVHCRF